jgi:plastocyanin
MNAHPNGPRSRDRLCVAALLALCACGGGGGSGGGGGGPTAPNPTGPSGSSSASVAMRTVADGYGDYSRSFDPTQASIARGGSVTWNNATGETHNVTFNTATGAPANIPDHSGGSNQRTFSVAGVFSYSCTNHVGMSGQVSVQ